MPNRLDAVAAQSAAGTLPRAIEVNAIDDWTVEGSAQSRITPVQSGGVSSPGNSARFAPRPNAGNSTNVEASTTTCSRQCRRARQGRLRRQPRPVQEKQQRDGGIRWRIWRRPRRSPCAGSTDARPTMPTIAAI